MLRTQSLPIEVGHVIDKTQRIEEKVNPHRYPTKIGYLVLILIIPGKGTDRVCLEDIHKKVSRRRTSLYWYHSTFGEELLPS